MTRRKLFQSAPAIAGGRIRSIRPRHTRAVSFNPRPPLLAGESWPGVVWLSPRPRFNPRPPLLAGESFQFHFCHHGAGVSIRARHCWRANRSVLVTWTDCKICFNPRPPLLAGESGPVARPGALVACFNPRPPLLAGESRMTRWCRVPGQFQSAPAIAGGRIVPWGWTLPGKVCFNPRPPLLAGESALGWDTAVGTPVSIRARHCWRANQPGAILTNALPGVSIRARHCWRANLLAFSCNVARSARFNPRPPLLAGESVSPPTNDPAEQGFNPRPPLLAGESPMAN